MQLNNITPQDIHKIKIDFNTSVYKKNPFPINNTEANMIKLTNVSKEIKDMKRAKTPETTTNNSVKELKQNLKGKGVKEKAKKKDLSRRGHRDR